MENIGQEMSAKPMVDYFAPLMEWLQKHMWPLEGELVSPDFVAAGTALGVWEGLNAIESLKGAIT